MNASPPLFSFFYGGTFVIYTMMCILAVFFLVSYVPETRYKPVELPEEGQVEKVSV